METEHAIHKVLEELGYLRGKVEAIDEKVTVQNGSVAKLKEKVQGYDIILGKIGVGLSLVVIVASIIISITTEAIKKMLHL